MDIREATRLRCISEQVTHQISADIAREYRAEGDLVRARVYQEISAKNYSEAWMRLARLAGIE